jgi:hypothetical protein
MFYKLGESLLSDLRVGMVESLVQSALLTGVLKI